MGIDALIPARGGSKRVPGKNMKPLHGQPLVYWTIKAAQDSGIFDRIVVSTDDACTREFCQPICDVVDRLPEHATDTSPDIDWIRNFMENNRHNNFFMTLRPTSPFRTMKNIIDAWGAFIYYRKADSLRSVSLAKAHPGKMWHMFGAFLEPVMNIHDPYGNASYNLPTQLLPTIYQQNACIEIGLYENIVKHNSVSGRTVIPFIMSRPEDLDINTAEDFIIAEHYIKEGMVTL